MSFSAEMKDFINAYSTGQKINASRTDQDYKEALTDSTKKKTERENDPDTLELQDKQARANLAKTQAEIARTGAATGYTNAMAGRIKQLGAVNAGGVGSGLLPPAGAGGLVNTMQPPDEFAEGGAVPDDVDEDDTLPAQGAVNTSAAPVQAAPQQTDTDFSAARRSANGMPAGLNGIVSPQLIHDATKAGMTFGVEAFGLGKGGGVRSASQKLAAQQFAAGRGGLSTAEMEAAKKAVDPEGRMTDSQRNMAALGSVYQYQLNKGNPEGAQRVAFQMLQHYRVAAQRYAAIAAHAAQQGDLDLATKAAVKAYANVPDGRDLNVMIDPDDPKRVLYNFTNENGDVVMKGLATPQQLASSAMGMTTTGFDKAILSAAGARELPKTEGKPQSARDRKTMDELAQAPVDVAKEAWQTKNKDAQPDEEYWGDLSDATKHILNENPRATPREAFKAAQALHTLDKDDPGKTNFKIEPSDNDSDKTSTIKFNNGLKIKLDDDQLETVLLARAARLKKADTKQDDAQDAEESPGIMSKLGALGGAIGGALDTSPKVFPGGAGGAGAVDTGEPASRPQRQYTPYMPPQSTANQRPAVE